MRHKHLSAPNQTNLLDLLQQAQAGERPADGSLNVQHLLRGALNQALKRTSLSRHEVAARMSDLTGEDISKFQIDAWTAESKTGHRMPAEFLPAFCEATGDTRPLQVLGETAGVFLLPGPEALRAEIQRLEEQSRQIQAEKRKRQLFLQQMEGAGCGKD